MGNIKKRSPVKLFIAFIFNRQDILESAKILLKKKFGDIDFQSQAIPFIHTQYYRKELGDNLKREFISFRKLVAPENAPKIKITTNKVEERFRLNYNRQINIDPGYLDLSKVILLSTKDYKHRVYLNKGIYAEVTLFYQNKTFKPWEWTYPDYGSEEYISIFNELRSVFLKQRK